MSDKSLLDRFAEAQDSLIVQQSDFSLSAIFEMVQKSDNKKPAIDIDPHYQRRERWSTQKQSALIESFLLNVPVPPVYLSEDDYGTYSVIDGKQRITAIKNFLSGALKLKALSEFPELEGYVFNDLPSQLKNALTVRPYIRVITLLRQSDPTLKYEVFLRLNTGGESLKPQEIRNVAYSGPFNDLLFSLSENEFLKERLKIDSIHSTSYRNMDDVEHVLRFFTLEERWKNMGGVLGTEMDHFMAQNRDANTVPLRRSFERALNACQHIWGVHTFHKPVDGGWREQTISPLFDAQMVAVSMLSDSQIATLIGKSAQVIEVTIALFESDSEFTKSVSQSTNNASAVRTRVTKMYDMLVYCVGA